MQGGRNKPEVPLSRHGSGFNCEGTANFGLATFRGLERIVKYVDTSFRPRRVTYSGATADSYGYSTWYYEEDPPTFAEKLRRRACTSWDLLGILLVKRAHSRICDGGRFHVV